MVQITAALVKALREETGQGMMECKKALTETNGDLAAAKDLLRVRGQFKAETKAGRTTSEGLVQLLVDAGGTMATMVEVVCETDFCARNDVFSSMVAEVTRLAAAAPPGEIAATDEMENRVQKAFEQIGESMHYVRGVKLVGEQVGVYRHHNNKVGVIIAVNGKTAPTLLTELCMHIAFHCPLSIAADDLPGEVIEREKAVAKAQAIEQGKSVEIAEKMVAGKIKKFCQQNCLLEQPFIKDEDRTVKQVLGETKLVAFARYEVGQAAMVQCG